MKLCVIIFTSMQDIEKFLKVIDKQTIECYLTTNFYKLNAKSLLGIFSLFLEEKIVLEIDVNDDFIKQQILCQLQDIGLHIIEI